MRTTDQAASTTAGGQEARVSAQTLDRGLQVLEVIARAPHALSVAEVAALTGIHRTVAHRLAGTLAARGYLYKEAAGRYRLGPACLALASGVSNLRALARPMLEDLARHTGETVHLVVLVGRDVVFVDGIESPHALRVAVRTGRSYPAHATAAGKAWLAALSERRLHELYPDEHLPQATPQTVSSRTELERALATIRQRGYATNEGESESGVGSVGIVVRNGAGEPSAGIGVGMPLHRFSSQARRSVAEELTAAAASLAARLA
jgi:IclR family transcriptional regulator, acetate operon repressor